MAQGAALIADQPSEPTDGMFDEAGVDLTQIEMMLALTPRQRLEMLFETASSLARLMGHADTD